VEQKQLALNEVEHYHYLNQGQCPDVPNVDDAKDFEDLREALKIFGVDLEEQKALWRYLSGILHLGNITFKQEDDEREEAVLDQGKPLAYAAKLLGIKQDEIKKALLRRQATMGKNVVTIRLKVPEAEAARDAFAMLLYGRLFDHLVRVINKGLCGTGINEDNKRFIGVLDIYGFEFFEKNSFEQFCINWANEKLQQQFNSAIFKLEQAEYVREKIDWSYIEFADNQAILSLIEDKSPLGIIPILDEQCRFPRSDHLTFAEKLFNDFKGCPYFEKPKFAKDAFTIDHYAGKVTYQTLLFLEKNRDFLIPEHFIILGESEEKFVKVRFSLLSLSLSLSLCLSLSLSLPFLLHPSPARMR
jgi:myosin-5